MILDYMEDEVILRFWSFFFAFIIAKIILEQSILKFDFFQYSLFNNFTWIKLLSLIVEVIIFSVVFIVFYYLFTNFSKWKMRIKYELAQKKK
ncbi:hypothetical protein FG384_14415 [Psychrobacillus vulpis]|uniref:Uncharacterized protein n=2 Tax=Psychrobacillus vulpis TaxID=2325572 RepID=A0A544TNI6_9BACI|nr:hypothetical protein FG384_14415 [Psychrobacillus vulpis]